MPEKARYYHISSAVVAVLPQARNAIMEALAAFANVEVHAEGNGKIVIVIEGASAGVLGDTLARIAVLDGVIAANMVFEHVEQEEAGGDELRTDAA